MKVLVPVKNKDFWIKLIDAWAHEIYFWVVSKSWQESHEFTSILNRRDWALANVQSNSDAIELMEYAKGKWAESYITLNNSPIVDDAKWIYREIENIISLKPDAIIVKDIWIASMIREIDSQIPLHCSSLNQVINSKAVEFWLRNFNITRMIFPRNITIAEIKRITADFPALDFEVFIKNDWCYNTDWVCSSLHLEWLKRWIPYVCNRENLYEFNEKAYEEDFKIILSRESDCKMCLYWHLKEIPNLVSLKIVWREKPLIALLRDLNFILNSIKYAQLTDDEKELVDFNMKLHSKIILSWCAWKNCEYYKW
ncbi:MAG: Peptidase U32 [uncultured bacterium (gcode 4)]|uniref:Peptidase U32 n=1 Tax=uncultured bacterium (gcode 4) TaxID=1234023 RepID=K2GZL6_9BACT|nr:MAG: Peptidase U32 [uncultured bacterium (gcode 4)]